MIGCHDFGVNVHILFSFLTTDPKYVNGHAVTVWEVFVEHHVVIKPVICSIFKGILCHLL